MLVSMLLLGVLASIDPLRPAAFALVLSTRRQNGVAFLIGWGAALSVLFGLAFVALGADADQQPSSARQTWATVVVLIIGLALLVVAVRRFARRKTTAAGHVVPQALVRRLDDLDLRGAGLLGALIQPTSLTIAAAVVCARDRVGPLNLIIGFGLFAAVSTSALLGLFVYDTRHPAESRSRLTEIVDRLDREGPRLVTIASAVGGVYLVGNSLLHLA